MKKIFGCLVFLISTQTLADNLWCQGKVVGVYIAATSDVFIKGDWRGEWTKICNLKSDPAVDTVTCSLWSSYAASAVQNSTNVTVMYSGAFQCATVPSYSSAPDPQYFMLYK